MRTFIAIELPAQIKDYLSQLEEQLKTSNADVKWVNPKNIHLTLKFLGEIDEKKSGKVSEILEGIAKEKNPFFIRLSSLGAFPKIKFPRVIWIGIDKGDIETKEIAKALDEKIGIPAEDRPFSSHITIGRVKSNLNRERLVEALANLGEGLAEKKLEFPVTKITLYKSTLTPAGPIYEILKENSLKTI